MTLSDLKISGVENFQRVMNIEIIEAAHKHGVCRLSLSMKKDFKQKDIINFAKKKITVKADKTIIFSGIIIFFLAENREDEQILHITAESLSCQLKVSEKKSCTFQKSGKKFSDMLNVIKKNYSGSDLICAEDKQVAELIYRNNLTDWEFLCELAERHGQILFADSKTDKLRISLGFKSFKDFSADDSMLFLRQSVALDFYKRLEQNTYSGARSAYFIDTEFLTQNLEIGVGYGMKYDNQLQAVIAAHIYLRENVLFNEIKIRHKEGCRAEARDVTKFFDKFYYLTGKVLESKDNDVKIHFDCDKEQNKNDALQIPYESAVSNYLYTMPDEKDKVFVYVDNLRQAVMGSLREKDVSDDAKQKSFKAKKTELNFDDKKISFDAEKKSELSEEDGIKITAKKDIIFAASGDIYLQSAAGLMPDNQLTMAAAHMTGYGIYTAAGGQPPSVQFNPSGSTVGKVQAQITGAGSKKESVELSDLAKELNKITNTQEKKSENKNSGGGSGGTLKLEAKSSLLVQVESSSFELKGSATNIKTRVMNQVGYIPAAGGGTGSLSKFEGGNPKNRSDKIKAEKGQEDRSRQKEKIPPTADTKNISI